MPGAALARDADAVLTMLLAAVVVAVACAVAWDRAARAAVAAASSRVLAARSIAPVARRPSLALAALAALPEGARDVAASPDGVRLLRSVLRHGGQRAGTAAALAGRFGIRELIPDLDAALRYSDARRQALDALGRMPCLDAAALLLEAAGTLGEEWRRDVAAALASLARHDPGLLRPFAESPREWARAMAAEALGCIDDPPSDLLLLLASDPSPEVRARAADAAARGPFGLGAAARLLADPVWFVRARAARALRDRDAQGLLFRALADPHPWVARNAADSLRAIRPDPDVLLPLLRHSNFQVRRHAAEVLAALGHARALAFDADRRLSDVRALFATGVVLPALDALREASSDAVIAILALLSEMPDARAVPFLGPFLERAAPRRVRVAAVAALAACAGVAAASELDILARDPDEDVRLAAAVALAEVGREDLVAPLVHDPSSAVRLALADLLADRAALDALALDPHPAVRRRAADRLAALGLAREKGDALCATP